jgi:acyl-CoA thioester hydrolase
VDELYELVGLGPDYLKQHNHSTMVVESHVRYLREVKQDDPMRVTVQLLDADEKRIHLFEEMRHATENWLSATSENMTLSVNMTTRKVAPFTPGVLHALRKLQQAHASLARPEGAGRRVSMPAKA